MTVRQPLPLLVSKPPHRDSIPDLFPANSTIQSAGAGTTTAALAGQVPKEQRREAQVIPGSDNEGSGVAPDVPEVVQESIDKAKTSPEAAANETAVEEKAAVENELLKDVKTTDAIGEPAPTASATTAEKAPAPTGSNAGITGGDVPALTPAQETGKEDVQKAQGDSRDVSPLSHPKRQSNPPQPKVTTGVASSSTPAKSEASPASPASPASKASATATTDKKAKRGSIFGKLKDKFRHKDEK